MIGYTDKKRLVRITVDNNSCSSCISHNITTMWSIVNIIYFSMLIYDVDDHSPYFDAFV